MSQTKATDDQQRAQLRAGWLLQQALLTAQAATYRPEGKTVAQAVQRDLRTRVTCDFGTSAVLGTLALALYDVQASLRPACGL